MKFVFIAGPYGAHLSYDEISQNILNARKVAAELAREGVAFYCPHLHTAHFECSAPDEALYGKLHAHFLGACDALLLLPGWKNSSGTLHEQRLAFEAGQPIFEWDAGDFETSRFWAWCASPVKGA